MPVRQHVVKPTREGSSRRVTIPNACIEALKVEHDEHYAVSVVGRCIVLTPIGDVITQRVMISESELLARLMPAGV